MVNNDHLLPMEMFLRDVSENERGKNEFPPMREGSYFSKYWRIKETLIEYIYPQIGSGMSVSGQCFTDHSKEHFNQVIVCIGDLLGVNSAGKLCQNAVVEHIRPYEIYFLLLAALVHDIGNIIGRRGHRHHPMKVLRDVLSRLTIDRDQIENGIACRIAQAHTGDGDVISEIEEQMENVRFEIRTRMLASILRFADEISETKERASLYRLANGTLPAESGIYHAYANAIYYAKYASEGNMNVFTIHYGIQLEGMLTEYDKEGEKIYLVKEIFNRLDKLNRERMYCNIFSRKIYTVDVIRASICIRGQDDIYDLEVIKIPEIRDEGYPSISLRSKSKFSDWIDNINLAEKAERLKRKVNSDE